MEEEHAMVAQERRNEPCFRQHNKNAEILLGKPAD
jgi:hypothetical protein